MLKIKAILLASITASFLAACDQGPLPSDSTTMSSSGESQEIMSITTSWPKVKGDNLAEVAIDDNETMADNVIVILDMSGSMEESNCASPYSSKSEAAKNALTAFSKTIPDDFNLGLVIFQDGTPKLSVPLAKNNRKAFMQAVNSAMPLGGTPLFSSLEIAYNEIERQGLFQRGYGNYRILFITDGAHGSGQNPNRMIGWITQNTPVEIHTAGFCINEGHSLNIPGETVYSSASNPEQLLSAMKSVLAESGDFVSIDFTN